MSENIALIYFLIRLLEPFWEVLKQFGMKLFGMLYGHMRTLMQKALQVRPLDLKPFISLFGNNDVSFSGPAAYDEHQRIFVTCL